MRIVILLLIGVSISCTAEKDSVSIDLEELTVSAIHEAYENGDYTSEDLVNAYLNRISQYDSLINAISVINPNAIAIAKSLDEEYLRTGNLRSLHGIPMIVKDNFNTVGLPTTAGALALKNFIPDENAFMVQKLIDAGAIVLAKSNMAEWAFSPMHSESSTKGTTRNAYNPEYVPAGSSGGTAAAIAANFGTIGLGTDTGNSIRGPSSHGSLVGFRSTLGLTSRSGIVPLYLRNDVAGPMCRTVEDATRVLNVIAGYDPEDQLTSYSEGNIKDDYLKFLMKDLEGMRIGVLGALIEKIDPEIDTLFRQAIQDLETIGATLIDPVEVPNFSELRQNQWCAEFRTDLEAYLSKYVKSDTIKTLEDVARIGTTSQYAEEGVIHFLTANGRYGAPEVPCGDAYTDTLRIAFRQAIEEVMDNLDLDAIIYPSWNFKPALIERFQEDYKGDNSQIISPHTGQPAFTVPMGFTTGNLPAGLQLLGRMYDEASLIRISYAYEQATKHRIPAILRY